MNNLKKLLGSLGLVLLSVAIISLWNNVNTNIETKHSDYQFKLDGNQASIENHSHSFDSKISPFRFELQPRNEYVAYELSYQVSDVSVNGTSVLSPNKIKTSVNDDKLSYKINDKVAINYTNSTKGLRQDFVISEGPTMDANFLVDLELSTSLEVSQNDKYSISLTHANNDAVRLNYKDLLVFDNGGLFLDCEMKLSQIEDDVYNIQLIAFAEEVSYPVTIDPLSTSDSSFESLIDSTYTGYAVSGDCDFNNDGYCDVSIGSYGYSKDMVKFVGKVDVFYGSAAGTDITGIPDFSIEGDTVVTLAGYTGLGIGGRFGYSLDCAGDPNNDGFDDIIIGAPNISLVDTVGGASDTIIGAGAFYVYYGSASGLSTMGFDVIYGSVDTLSLGEQVSSLGDTNGDGFDDVMVSSPGANSCTGSVRIHTGNAAGISASAVKVYNGQQLGQKYGTALAGPGDLDGDGFNDILIGSHNYNIGTDTAIGRVDLYLGSTGFAAPGSNSPSPWSAFGEHKNAQFGYSISGGGTYLGAGTTSVVIGSNRYNPSFVTTMPDTIEGYGTGGGRGAAYIYRGQAGGLQSTPSSILLNDVGASGFGSSVSDAGDVDGDGVGDIIIGAPFYSVSQANEGAAYTYYGVNYQSGIDTTFDWCATGELPNAFLGISLDNIGGCDSLVQAVADTTGVVIGAYGYGTNPNLYNGAAFLYKQGTCGLVKYEEPQFLTFPLDTIFASSDTSVCGAIVLFDDPMVGSNCPNTLSISAGMVSGSDFPIGNTSVTYQIDSNGQTVDSTFVITVIDVHAPEIITCTENQFVQLPAGETQTTVTWNDPVFDDNSLCSGGSLTVTKEPGTVTNPSIEKGDMLTAGVYVLTYKAVDEAGNEAYCTFRVIVNKVSLDGRDCEVKSIQSEAFIGNSVLAGAKRESASRNLIEDLGFNNSNFGIDLLLSLMEGLTGLSIPGWVKAVLGQAGTGINLAFVSVNFSFLPTLDLTYGVFLDTEESSQLSVNVNYAGEVCASKLPDKLYGCRDVIPFSSSFTVDPSEAFLQVNPGDLEQTIGVFIRDFEFRWPILISASACVGVPLCVPFVGCAGCAGYTASYTKSFDIFDPVRELEGSDAIELDLITACDLSFENGATIATVFACQGIGTGTDSFIKSLFEALPIGPNNIPIDPFYYDASLDQFVFDPGRLPKIGEKIPEMRLRFGRLTQNEMGPTFINGSLLTTSGRERSLFAGEFDVFSLLAYAIPEPKKQALCVKGIEIGTRSIGFSRASRMTVDPNSGQCSGPLIKDLKVDVLDVNLILRSEFNVNYNFNPNLKVESMDLGVPTYWERPDFGLSGTSQTLTGVNMDENILIGVPDGQTEPYFISNVFSSNGVFQGNETKTLKVDLELRIIEFLFSYVTPSGFGPLITLGPFNLLTLGSERVREYNRTLDIPNFNASVTMTPDDIPPIVACNDTTVYMDEYGYAFLDLETAFNSDPNLSYDLPLDGSGMINLIDIYPDTIFCSDYPFTSGFLVTEDDNCNFDTCEFLVTVLDTMRPFIGCQDLTIGIGENGTLLLEPDEIIIGAVDNCMAITPEIFPRFFTCDDVGQEIIVTATVTDIAGNMNSCTATVSVVDTLPLFMDCPYLAAYPVTRNTDPGVCTYNPNETEFRPTLVAPDCNTVITYNLSGATTGTGISNVDDVAFNLGETTITYTATDASGNVTTCGFTVIVEDRENPIILCLQDVTLSTNEDILDNYDCSTGFDFRHPNPSDNCSITSYDLVYTYPNGEEEIVDLLDRYNSGLFEESKVFDIGLTTLTYTVVDTMNNSASCVYNITVEDDELPTIFCQDVVSCQEYLFTGAPEIQPNDVTSFIISVPNDILITDLNVSLIGSTDDFGLLDVELISPNGTTLSLVTGICATTTTFDIELDDDAFDLLASADCSLINTGLAYSPAVLLFMVNGESSLGEWELVISNASTTSCGSIDEFKLEICGNTIDQLVNGRVSVLVNTGECAFAITDDTYNPVFIDNCPDVVMTHDYILGPFDNTLVGSVLPLGETSIVWTTTDASGNSVSCTMIYEVLDQSAPEFINCPANDIIQDAEPGICGAYVNFSAPLAFDECDDQVDVVQIDATGLISGSVFPVGSTELIYQVSDNSGNTTTCTVVVIVNDTQGGTFNCPSDLVAVNDDGSCTAVVNGIPPQNISDNCIDNMSITYQIEHPANSGNIIAGGIEDASGNTFLSGDNVVTYQMSSQPGLLITEVTQEIQASIGGEPVVPYTILTNDDYIEITNLGPAAYDISGLSIERFGAGLVDVFEVPSLTIINPGETLVLHYGNGTDDEAIHFYNLPCAVDISASEPAGYALVYKDRVLDVVTTNGFIANGMDAQGLVTALDWTGSIPTLAGTAGIIRKFSFDSNIALDWVVSENCYPLTIGILNPDIEAYAWNGTVTSLQSEDPTIQTCDFTVSIIDSEAPSCAMAGDTLTYQGEPVQGGFDSCNIGVSTITSTDDCRISDINLTVNGTVFGTDSIFMTLTSPMGTTVLLTTLTCPTNVDELSTINITFDEEAEDNLSVYCNGGASDGTYQQLGSLLDFYGELSAGDWSLNVGGIAGSDSSVDIQSWSLEVSCLQDFQMDPVVINNETGLCGAEFAWIHPFFIDNCSSGSIGVNYYADDPNLVTPTGGVLNGSFGNGGYDAVEFFSVGITTVEYTLTDGSGVQSQCSFTVEVVDAEAPLVTSCPADIVVQLSSGLCREVVFYEVLATDNCVELTLDYSIDSGTYFDIGTTPVTVVITDTAGNTAECEFNVIVNNFTPESLNLACNDLINISLDQNCEVEVNADMLLEGNIYSCYEDYIITLEDSAGDPITTAPIIGLAYQGQLVTYTVLDPNTGNSCWGELYIEEKLQPVIECPIDVVISCDENPLALELDTLAPNFGMLKTGEVRLVSCEQYTSWFFEDEVVSMPDCSDPIKTIFRTFYLTDDEQNTVECTQRIDIAPFGFDDIVWPEFVLLTCDDVAADESLISPENTGYPIIGEAIVNDVNALCDLSHSYTDNKLWICGNSFEILRIWTIRNRCLPIDSSNPITFTQLIEVLDDDNPVLTDCPGDITVSTEAWLCSASVDLPLPAYINDGCSEIMFDAKIFGGGTLSITGTLGNNDLAITANYIQAGTTSRVEYLVMDECGNESACSFSISVFDGTPPVAIATQNLVISLTTNGQEYDGNALLYTESVDNGSYDNCSDVRLEIRRVDGPPNCGNLGLDDYNNNATFSNTSLGVNTDNNINDTDNGNIVKVCCEDLTSVDGSGAAFGIVQVELRVWDDGNKDNIIGNEGDNYASTWAEVRVESKLPPTIVCPADATVSCESSWYVHQEPSVPTDEEYAALSGPEGTGVAFGSSLCGSVSMTYQDSYSEDNCYTQVNEITRTWCVEGTNICCDQKIDIVGSLQFDPSSISLGSNSNVITNPPSDIYASCLDGSEGPLEPTWLNAPCELIGFTMDSDTFFIEGEACIKVINAYSVVNWCTDEEWVFEQTIQVIDDEDPEITVDSLCVAVNEDCLALPGSVQLTAFATDSSEVSTCMSPWLKWQVEVDLNSDWVVDHVFSSYVSPQDPNFGTGQNEYYVPPTISGDPVALIIPSSIPSSKYDHRVVWTVSDGCGNVTSKTTVLQVVDKKAPSPYCHSISSAFMTGENPMVELWACDFVIEGLDNCTSSDQLRYTFSNVLPENDPTYDSETKCSARTFTCADINNANSGIVSVDVYSWDEYDNFAVCNVELTLNGLCDPDGEGQSRIAGMIDTDNGQLVKNVEVIIESNQPEYPYSVMTDDLGTYMSHNHLNSFDYSVSAFNNSDHRAGVSTLDILYIQRHLLNIASLNSPYRYIAADVNNDEKVTAADIIDLRKLILEVYTAFPSNDSWRFVDASQALTVANAFDFREYIDITELNNDMTSMDWKGVKIGDVNGSYVSNNLLSPTEFRSSKTLELSFKGSKTADGLSVAVSSSNFIDIAGYQFTLNTNGLNYTRVEAGAINMTNDNIALISKDLLTVSWNTNTSLSVATEQLFTLHFSNSDLSGVEDLTISSDATQAEAYTADLAVMNVMLANNGEDEFALMQNEPNPFESSTTIAFSLPSKGLTTLKMFDINGKVVKQITGSYPKGWNSIQLSQQDLGVSGVLYYTLESGDFTETRKMILVE